MIMKQSREEKTLFIVCIAAIVMMFVRCFFGVDFTDEAYYVSDALAIMHGNVPYAMAISLAAGQSFIPIIFYKAYELFVPDLEGIVLYSRLCYVLFRILILVASCYFLKDELSRKYRLYLFIAMVPYMGSILQNFSYNTISVYCTLFTSVLLYTAQQESGWKAYTEFIIAGIFSAFSVFAHPVSALAVIINFILILIFNKPGNRIKNLLWYCFGGISVILVVLAPIVHATSWEKLVYGIETLLYYRPSTSSGTVAYRIIDTLKLSHSYILRFLVLTGGIAFFISSFNSKKIYIKTDRKNELLLALGISLFFSLAAIFVKENNVDFLYWAGLLFAIASILAVLVCNKIYMRHSLVWYLLLPIVSYVAFLVLFTDTGVPRFYYGIPLCAITLGIMFCSESDAVKIVAGILAVSFALMQGFIDYKFIYRDALLPQLETRVEGGVYKGIYTIPERAHDIVELEMFLEENLSETELVSFRDNVPVGYLMHSRNVCDVRTWDEMQYSYGCDDPTSMYRYYKNVEAIPDVIVYIDFGRDETLSIDNLSVSFQYNDFVNQYYDLAEETLNNQTFYVKMFRNNGSFSNNFDELIASVKVKNS